MAQCFSCSNERKYAEIFHIFSTATLPLFTVTIVACCCSPFRRCLKIEEFGGIDSNHLVGGKFSFGKAVAFKARLAHCNAFCFVLLFFFRFFSRFTYGKPKLNQHNEASECHELGKMNTKQSNGLPRILQVSDGWFLLYLHTCLCYTWCFHTFSLVQIARLQRKPHNKMTRAMAQTQSQNERTCC